MNSPLSEKDYRKIEFSSAVFFVSKELDLELKEAFLYCFRQAKKHKIKTGYIEIEEIAYNQFVYFVKKNKLFFE